MNIQTSEGGTTLTLFTLIGDRKIFVMNGANNGFAIQEGDHDDKIIYVPLEKAEKEKLIEILSASFAKK